MPTATTTVSYSTHLPLKAGVISSTPAKTTSPTASTSTSATLRSLYNRAARAFVLRDIPLTYSLIQSAFALLKPPNRLSDVLEDHRRKWDILRITFESTVYTSPPSNSDSWPESLRAVLAESAQALSTSMYTRSLTLFTPAPTSGNVAQKITLNAAYLPPQVLTTLVYSSLKLDAPDVGRIMIEDWLARREPRYSLDAHEETEGDGYVKVLDLYCLHILPKLEQWDYAKEFLEYESEMPSDRREHIKTSLNNLYAQAMSSRRPFKPATPPLASVPVSPRSYSPAPSSNSSSSSSISTTSTHTVVPATPRPSRPFNTVKALSSLSKVSSSDSLSSDDTATPRAAHAPLPATGGPHRSPRQQAKSRTNTAPSSTSSREHLAHLVSVRPGGPPSMYALLRASLAPYLTTKTATFVVLLVLVPLLSLILRLRRRRRVALAGGAAGVVSAVATSASNAEMVRRRLQAAGVEGGLVQRAWGEVVRVVGDTVRMAGSGLV